MQTIREPVEKEDMRFETLMAELSAYFINLPADRTDAAIEAAQHLFCEHLGLDRSTLFQHSNEGPGMLLLTHLYQTDTNLRTEKRLDPILRCQCYWVAKDPQQPTVMMRIDAKATAPWIYGQLRRGQTVVITSLDDLPAEAAVDKELFLRYGTKSSVIVPLIMGGTFLGCLSFATLREARTWPESMVERFRFVADVFTNALARKRADVALREKQAQLQHALQTARLAHWEYDIARDEFTFNDQFYSLLRTSAENEGGYTMSSARYAQRFLHPDDAHLVAAEIQNAQATIDPDYHREMDRRIIYADGETGYFTIHIRVEKDAQGRTIRTRGANMDITLRKRAEEALRESEARFRLVADSAPVLIWVAGPDKLCTFFNQSWLNFTGRTLEQEMGNGWVEGVHPDDRASCFQGYLEAFDARLPFTLQYRLRRKDGEYRWISDHGVPRHEAGGAFAGYIGSCVDVTGRMQAEERLRKSLTEIQSLKDQLQAETDYLRSEIRVTEPFGAITGESKTIRKALLQVQQVAPTDSTVLICGETGTGKELFAEAIHRLSSRKVQMIVKVNCAALPPPLVESELFGREKGAYTGALAHQRGRFDIANNSTIFLDEVGELLPEVQVKLLRVLQEGQFERLGSPKTVKVNVRLIAATNRDLAEEVRKGHFRQDLFYRLNVFPIKVPALRERVEDIPLLVWTFVEEFSARMGKKITKISRKTMELLQRYSWPGNVRELRNVIERSVIISTGETLRVPQFQELQPASQPVTLAENEREHILRILETTMWHIKGPHGAASKLGLKPSTLYTRMQKLGIPNRSQRDGMRT